MFSSPRYAGKHSDDCLLRGIVAVRSKVFVLPERLFGLLEIFSHDPFIRACAPMMGLDVFRSFEQSKVRSFRIGKVFEEYCFRSANEGVLFAGTPVLGRIRGGGIELPIGGEIAFFSRGDWLP